MTADLAWITAGIAALAALLYAITKLVANSTELIENVAKLKDAVQSLFTRSSTPRPVGIVPDIRSPPYIGREREMARIEALLDGREPRVTVVAPAAWGKRRLVVKIGDSLLHARRGGRRRYRDGVWYLDLKTLADSSQARDDPDRLAREVALQLGLADVSVQQLRRQLTSFLATKSALLVWANAHHLPEQCRTLSSTWLTACPDIGILATAEAPLGLDDEQIFDLPPMLYPDAPDSLPALPELRALESVRLFEAVALGGTSRTHLSENEIQSAGRICHRLGGVPGAIMVAAARVAIGVSIDDVEHDLHDPSEPIVTAFRASYQALIESDRRVCRSVAVFAGSFTMAAAKEICATPILDAKSVPAAIARLVAARLVHRQDASEVMGEGSREVRFRMIPAVQDVAGGCLTTAEGDSVRRQHALYYSALAARLEPQLTSSHRDAAFEIIDDELPNLRSAISWATVTGQHDIGLSMVGSLFWYWNLSGLLGEGSMLGRQVIERFEGTGLLVSRAKALYSTGGLAFLRSEYDVAGRMLGASVSLWREEAALASGDDDRITARRGLGLSLVILAMTDLNRGELDRAQCSIREAVALLETIGDPFARGLSLNDLGQVIEGGGGRSEAAEAYEKSLSIWQQSGDDWGRALTLGNAGQLATCRLRLDEAQALLTAALEIQTSRRDKWGRPRTLMRLGHLAWHRARQASGGHRRRALLQHLKLSASLYRESLLQHQRLERRQLICECLEGLAHIASALGDCERAGHLYGGAETLRGVIGARRSPIDEEEFAAGRLVGCSRDELRAAENVGRQMRLDEVCAEAHLVVPRRLRRR